MCKCFDKETKQKSKLNKNYLKDKRSIEVLSILRCCKPNIGVSEWNMEWQKKK